MIAPPERGEHLMKLLDFVSRKAMVPALKARDKRGVIQELVQVIKKTYSSEKFQPADVVHTILEREKLGSTGLGGGVAVPHSKLPGLKSVLGAFGRLPQGVDFSAVDGESVTLVFLILSPADQPDSYVQALQATMRAIRAPHLCKFLRAAKSQKEIEEIFRDAETSTTAKV